MDAIAGAKYDLKLVFKLIDENKVYFSARSRSTWSVLKVYEKSAALKGQNEAEEFILTGIKNLKAENFYHRILQWNDPKCVADVYGLIFAGRPWYIKFQIEDGELEQISFHPPEKEFTTVGGLTIPQGEL